MKESPTLADAAIRESLRNHRPWVPQRIGQKIANARKFVLDAEASRFLSDLSHASFVADVEGAPALTEKTRRLARLPHRVTWIEYDPREFKKRTDEAYSTNVNHVGPEHDSITGKTIVRASEEPKFDPEEIIPRMGWLLEQFGETFVCTLIVGGNENDAVLTLPCAFAWTTDDSIPTIAKSTPADNPSDSRIATGIHGYNVPNVVIGTVPEMNFVSAKAATRSLVEWMGELRFVWALLAAVNDIPVGIKHVKPSKGFFAKGKYRKFVEHSVISILIPKQRDPKSFARSVVAAARRRAHLVRGHWRRNWRQEGERIWISEHSRGDASLGYVLHDYSIQHEEEKEAS